VAVMAAKCQCDPDLITGRLIHFWSWLDQESADGMLPGMDIASLAAILHIPAEFFEAMVAVSWLIQIDDGLVIPNWERWFSRSTKKRLQTAKRVDNHRGDTACISGGGASTRHINRDCNAHSVTGALQNSRLCNAHSVTEALLQNNTIHIINDDDDDEKRGKGGVGERGGPHDPKALYEMYAGLWPNRRVAKKRDRVLLWRVVSLAAIGHGWAQVALYTLADAKPENPGAYLQKLVFELGPREPHIGLILGEVPVPAEITNPRPPAQGPPRREQPGEEKPLTPEEGRAMVQEVLAILKAGGNGNGQKT
jgi:hypothetical protein